MSWSPCVSGVPHVMLRELSITMHGKVHSDPNWLHHRLGACSCAALADPRTACILHSTQQTSLHFHGRRSYLDEQSACMLLSCAGVAAWVAAQDAPCELIVRCYRCAVI